MSEEQSSNPRDEARKALRKSAFSSVKGSATVAGAVTAAAGVVGGFLGFRDQLSSEWIFGLAVIVILSSLISFCLCEFERFRFHRILLQEILDSEKNYEMLLTEVRRERDELSNIVAKNRVEMEIVRATHMSIGTVQKTTGDAHD